MEKILIIDDDINLCSVLSEELSEIGYDTHYVTNADRAFDYLNAGNKVDLILLDLVMPDKDGFYVLKKLNEENFNIKVIVLTAYADVKSAIEAAKLGAADFINKPYDLDELIIAMRKVLQKEEYEN